MRKLIYVTVFIFCLAIKAQAQPQPLLQYSKTYPPISNSSTEKSISIDYDNAGNAYVTGTTDVISSNNDIFTIKYSPSGTKLWEKIYAGAANGDDQPVKIITDKNSNRVYVTGFSKGNGTGYDWITIAYNAITGDTLWTQRYDDPSHGDDKATDIEIDRAGNIYVCGTGFKIISTYNYFDAALIKYSPTGNKIRQVAYNSFGGGDMYTTNLAITTNDNCQIIFPINYYHGSTVYSLDSTFTKIGNILTFSNREVKKIMLNNNNINTYYVSVKNSQNSGTAILRYAIGNYSSDWYNSDFSSSSFNITDFDIDASTGDPYILYYDTIDNKATAKYKFAKLNGTTRDTIFTRVFDPTDQIDRPLQIKVGHQGTPVIYITGNTLKNGKWQNYTVAYDSETGDVKWSPPFNQSCPNSGNVNIVDMKLDNYNNIYMTGNSTCGGTYDALTVKYCGSIPVANAGADKPVCMGSSVQIGSTPLANYIYSWSPTTGLSNPNIANPLASPSANTTYVLTVTSPSGCSATDDVVVTVVAVPVANAGANQSICAGNGVQIGAATVAGNTYAWSPTTGLSNPNISNPITSNIYTQTYTLTVTNTLNCTATDQVVVTIKPLPNTTLTVSPSNTICRGDAVTLTASGATTYVWSPSGSGTSQVITPSDAITYSITGTTNGCDKSASQTITVRPIPATPTISQSHDTLYSNVSITGASYKWYKNGTLLSTTTNPYIKISSTGNYTVQVVNNGCSATSAGFVVSSVAAIKNTTSAINKFEIYPNPVSQNLNINIQSNKNTTVQLRIFDINGKEMVADEIKITKGETLQKIDVSNFAKGMYVIQLTDDDGIATDKFVVE